MGYLYMNPNNSNSINIIYDNVKIIVAISINTIFIVFIHDTILYIYKFIALSVYFCSIYNTVTVEIVCLVCVKMLF